MAGRPRKVVTNPEESKEIESNQTVTQETKTPEIDIDKLIKQITQEVSGKLKTEYEYKISNLEKKLSEKIVQESKVENKPKVNKPKFRFIPDNTKIRIQSNIGGLFIFSEDRGKVRVFFQIDNFGQSTIISYEELRIFLSSKPTFIRKGSIAIVDVYSDADIELEDVITDLRLDKIYYDENKISPMNIEDLFDDKLTSESEFEKKLNYSTDMAQTVLEASYILYRRGLFSNNTKMNSIRQIFRNPNLFK